MSEILRRVALWGWVKGAIVGGWRRAGVSVNLALSWKHAKLSFIDVSP